MWVVVAGWLLYLFLASIHLPSLPIVWHCVETATVSKVFRYLPLGKTRVLWVAATAMRAGKWGKGEETHTA